MKNLLEQLGLDLCDRRAVALPRCALGHCSPGPAENRMLAEPALEASWRDQVLLARHSNVWLDLSALPHHLPEGDYPFGGIDVFVSKAADLVGADRLLYGTDAPGMLWMLTYQQMLDAIRLHCHSLNDEQRKLILGENSMQAYPW
jgi:predicted TIM-barrel fold metal-dependent hydrolase